MADLPVKRPRRDDTSDEPHTSASTSNESGSGALPYDNCEEDRRILTRNDLKRKQTTLDQFWTRSSSAKLEEDCRSGENTTAETGQETQKYGSSADPDAIETLEYDSDSVVEPAAGCADDGMVEATDSSPEQLELGAGFDELADLSGANCDLPPLQPSASHSVLFVPDSADERCTSVPKPMSEKVDYSNARWDNDHVRLPYSPRNKILVDKVIVGRWGKIVSSLSSMDFTSSHDIENAILSYNKYKWDFTELHHYFQALSEEEHDLFFSQTLPKIVELAVDLPAICTQPIPLLRKQNAASVSMSQKQAASLLANAFFCTFPARNFGASSDADVPRLPSINFNSLYRKTSSHSRQAQHAKLDCLLHYFGRVTNSMPRGTLTFRRQVLEVEDVPDWPNSNAQLQKLLVSAKGTIEDNGTGMLQVDFANKFIGGGVLGEGCVQEEIRFLICPELIVSRLITEELDANESLVVTGCERFSNYIGYGSSTRWLSDHRDSTEHDSWGRMRTQLVAIDAKVSNSLSAQLTQRWLERELNKAFCGFLSQDGAHCAVATGNWGCGAFGGDLRLKALLQLMAAAEAKRPVCYFTFDDYILCRELFEVWQAASSTNCTVGLLYTYILEATEQMRARRRGSSSDIYTHIIAKCTSSKNGGVSRPQAPSPTYSDSP